MSVKKLTDKLDPGPVFFVAPNPNRAIGLEKYIEKYHIICSHNLDIIEYLKDDGIPVLCLDNDLIKNTGKLLENQMVLDYIRSESGKEIPNIITFKPSPKIEKICEMNGFNYIGNDWRLNRKFENKINFVEISNNLKIPNAGSEIVKLGSPVPADKYFHGNGKCVVQFPRGYSGNSTFLLDKITDFDGLSRKYPGHRIKIAKYLSGETYTINGCVGKSDVFVGKPIYQITGLTDFNGNKLGTSGNDYVYPDKLDPAARKKIFDYTKKVGRFMSKEGYKGIFGLDFIVGDGGTVDLIEINPRLIGSIPVYTKLQIENGEIPFLAIHLREFLKENDAGIELGEQSYSSWNKEKNFRASQLILRNITKNAMTVKRSIVSGVYKVKGKDLIFQKKGYYIGKMLELDEILIQCIEEGSVVNSDMEYANIQSSYGIIKERKLNTGFAAIADFVLNSIKLNEII